MTALRISRDGTRALVASTRNGQSRIDVAGIVRDGRGRPLSLTTPLLIGAGLTDVVDATWVDPITVAVLGRGRERHAGRSPTSSRSVPNVRRCQRFPSGRGARRRLGG